MRSVLIGAVLGAAFSFLFLFIGDNLEWSGAIPTIIFVSIMGGAAYAGIESLKSYVSIEYGGNRLLSVAAFLLYCLVVILAFIIARLGPF